MWLASAVSNMNRDPSWSLEVELRLHSCNEFVAPYWYHSTCPPANCSKITQMFCQHQSLWKEAIPSSLVWMDREVAYFVDKLTVSNFSFEYNLAGLHHKSQNGNRREILGNRATTPEEHVMYPCTSMSLTWLAQRYARKAQGIWTNQLAVAST